MEKKNIKISKIPVKCLILGGKVSVNSLKKIIKNGYQEDKLNNINDYQLDNELSGERVQVYHNPKTNHTIVNHRGTKGVQDVITDMKLLFGNKSSKRFQHSKDVSDKAHEKYKNSEITQVGHSLGAQLAKEAKVKHNDETITYNGATTPLDLFNKQQDNEYNIRTYLDPISGIQELQPNTIPKNNITIPSASLNLLEEHRSEALNRLNQDRLIGGGGGASKPIQPAEIQEDQQQRDYDLVNNQVQRYQGRNKMKIKYLDAETKKLEANEDHDPYELYNLNQQKDNLINWNNLPYHKKHKILKEKLIKEDRVKPIIYDDQEKGGKLSKYKITKYSKDRAKELGVTIKPSTRKNKKIDVYKDKKFICSIGGIGYKDYPTFLKENGKEFADKRRELYKKRHEKDRKVIGSNGYYAFHILW